MLADTPKAVGQSEEKVVKHDPKKVCKVVFAEAIKLLLHLLVTTTDQYVCADVFSLLVKIQKHVPRLDEALLETPLVFQKLVTTLEMASPFVRLECLDFLHALLRKNGGMVANIVIMQVGTESSVRTWWGG